LTALHVSSDIIAHYQRVSLSAAVSSRQRHTWIKPEAVTTI